MFPVESTLKNTAVSEIIVKVGDKEVASKVATKENARNAYEDAIARGHGAVMAQEAEKAKDIIKMTVGGIKPRQEVQVTVKVLQVLEVENGAYQLRIPQSYFVKYDSGSIGTSPQTPYSLNISIENLQNIAYLSIPKNSFLKQSSEL